MANEIIKNMGFHHVALKASDFEKSLKMYKALGMTEYARWGDSEKTIAMLEIGNGGKIELFSNGGDDFAENGKWQHFAMCVDDVDAAYKTALKAGFKPLIPPKTVPLNSVPEKISINIAFVQGPDNEQVEFFKEV